MVQFLVVTGLLILAFGIFGTWALVQWTKKPKKFFRSGHADPAREEFTPEEKGTHAPQTVEVDQGGSPMTATIDEQAAALIQGQPHNAGPLTTSVDDQAAKLIDEEVKGAPDPADGLADEGRRRYDGPGAPRRAEPARPSEPDAGRDRTGPGSPGPEGTGGTDGTDPGDEHADGSPRDQPHDWSTGGFSDSRVDWSGHGFTSGEQHDR
ncbi:hypothetical protein CLV63_110131 [Murinocardiopsis flavida]|uniref:Uncharacterized protein n=1 Tax=Murinocardiopsis flavida TaxID=645275 RepID=A0A2P8DHY4_9ACTN|nr:hypothetical protein [Murinocardiopsis flavida]PSK96834.1 hypothetical protein CLV63_110131 [Murinocardiopsis flavida]